MPDAAARLVTKTLDSQALRDKWQTATPFSHLVIDDFVSETTLARLCQAVAGEPHWPIADEIVSAMASAPTVQHPDLRAFLDHVQSRPVRRQLEAIADLQLGQLLLRSYVYMPGHALLPHSDGRRGVQRRMAFVLYLHTDGCEGGDLRIYQRTLDERGHGIAATISPQPGRLVLFGVDDDSVHEVTEVTAGARVSLAGWFYAPGIDPQAAAGIVATPPEFDVIELDAPLQPETIDLAAPHIAAALRQDVPIRGRYRHADVAVEAPIVQRIVSRVAEQTGVTYAPLAAHLEILTPGDYVLSANDAARRPKQARLVIVADLEGPRSPGGGEIVWHGAHGPVHVSHRTTRCITVVEHGLDLARYSRRFASTAAEQRAICLVIYA